MEIQRTLRMLAVVMAAVMIVAPAEMKGHCDTMDGPVVKAAQRALASGDVRYALIWVKPEGEPEIRSLFEKVVALRAGGEAARAIADRYFFETLVRVHRAGEGAPYTGLKDAASETDKGIVVAEQAIEKGSQRALTTELTTSLHQRLESAFHRLQVARSYRPDDVTGGREYVEAYVTYLHLVERLYAMLGAAGPQHDPPAGPHVH